MCLSADFGLVSDSLRLLSILKKQKGGISVEVRRFNTRGRRGRWRGDGWGKKVWGGLIKERVSVGQMGVACSVGGVSVLRNSS